jgi:hypothetical protein
MNSSCVGLTIKVIPDTKNGQPFARLMPAKPDRRRDHVRSPLALRVNGGRSSDAQRIDDLHDRRSAGGGRHWALLLFAISQDRFRGDICDALAGGGSGNRMHLAGAAAKFHNRCSTMPR